MKHLNLQSPISKQKGAAVLLVSIVLLLGVTLITIFAARVGVMDQRISANEYRHKEAQSASHAAVEQASAFVENNIGLYDGEVGGAYPWKDCSDTAIKDDLPCTVGTTTYGLAYDGIIGTTTIDPIQYTVTLDSGIASNSYIVYKTSSYGAILTAIGVGESLDETGDAFSQVSYAQADFLTPGDIPPVLASGIGLNGGFTIIADPRVTHNGVACDAVTPTDVSPVTNEDGDILGDISIWVTSTGSSGTWQTCGIDAFVDTGAVSSYDGGDLRCVYEYDDTDDWSGCACDGQNHLSDNNNGGGTPAGYLPTYDHPDIKGYWNVIEPVPDSPFVHFFNGKSIEEMRAIIEGGDGIYVDDNCTASDFVGYETKPRPIVWFTGDCSIPDVGTQTNPIIIIVDGKVTINGNTEAWGVIVGLGHFQSNGSALIHGALIVDDAENHTFLTTGNYHQVYDFCVMSNLVNSSKNTDIAKIKFSAKDFKL